MSGSAAEDREVADAQSDMPESDGALLLLARDLCLTGMPLEEVEAKLVARGIPTDRARETASLASMMATAQLVHDHQRMGGVTLSDAGQRNLLYGGLWFLGGLGLTVLSYSEDAGGGRVVVCLGAMLYGVVRLIRGALQSRAG